MEGSDLAEAIARVKERVDITEIIGQRVTLDERGRGLCPFHEDTNPSLHVHREGQYFYCFGCGIGGDAIKFIEIYENKTFAEALRTLAEDAGVPVPTSGCDGAECMEEKRLTEDILTETAAFYHRALTPDARDYLISKRGLTPDTIARFRLGYAAGGLRKHLTEDRGYPLEACLKAGVLKDSGDGKVRDYFFERIIFPNVSRGRVVHLTGRRLDGREPKYLHLPGPIEHLYNEDSLRSSELILTEGPTDCIAAAQAGLEAVAAYGVANLKAEHADRFSRCLRVHVCFDGDKAGREGALKVATLLGERAQIVELPEGLDLSDFLRDQGKEELDELLSKGKDLIEYEISLIPPETPKTHLPRVLDPLLKRLAEMDKARSEAYLSHAIKQHFGLRRVDIDGYRDLVKKYRDDTKSGRESSGEASKEIYTAVFDGLVDLVDHEGQTAFLVKDEDALKVVRQVERDGVVYAPPPKDQIPWLLPRADEVMKLYELQGMLSQGESDGALYDDLIAYHKAISDLPGDEYYDLMAAWVLHTYLLENGQYTPIICLFAVPERGKSRTGKGMIYVAYRGIHVESLRDAYIVRVAHNLNASLFFDVKDIWRKAEKNGTEDILLHRFEKGARVPRVLYPDRGAHRDIVYYSIFGPTVIGTNEGVHQILETRAISVNMPETSKRFENDVTATVALPLKERLVVFRARHLGEALPDMRKPAAGRLGDILKPLVQVIRLVRPGRESAFLDLIRELEEKRMLEKADSLEAQILKVIVSLEEEVQHGILPVKMITDTLNEGRLERYHFSYQRIGRRLKAMGFDNAATADGASAIIWNEEHIGRMKGAYGLRKTSETPDTSETLVLDSGDTGIPDDTDVCRTPLKEVSHHGYSDPQE